jgi:hypothetical protein
MRTERLVQPFAEPKKTATVSSDKGGTVYEDEEEEIEHHGAEGSLKGRHCAEPSTSPG